MFNDGAKFETLRSIRSRGRDVNSFYLHRGSSLPLLEAM